MVVLKNRISYTFFVIFSVDLLATSGDITATWTSPMYPKLYSNDSSINPLPEPITPDQDAWIGSLVNVGAMIGTLPFGLIAEKFGRKIALLCLGIPHFIAYVSMALVKNVYVFYFGRLFGGMAMGAGYVLLPMYVAEVAHESQRGMYSVTLGIFWAFGNFLSYLIGPYLSVFWFNGVLALFPLTFISSFALLGTETPFYLVKTNQLVEAERVLMRLRSSSKDEIKAELDHISATLKKEKKGNLLEMFKSAGLRKALIISVSLISLQQFSGINAIFFYLQPIFEASGTGLSPDISALIVGGCIFFFSLFGPYIVEKFGRKTLMIFSSFNMSLCLVSMGAFFYIQEKTTISTDPISWLPITSLALLIFMFQMGVSTMPWTISSELFPSDLKQFAAAATSMSCYTSSFIITKCFNDMKLAFGTGGMFWFFAVFSLVASIFTFFYVPETKGKTFAEIQTVLRKTSIIPTKKHSVS